MVPDKDERRNNETFFQILPSILHLLRAQHIRRVDSLGLLPFENAFHDCGGGKIKPGPRFRCMGWKVKRYGPPNYKAQKKRRWEKFICAAVSGCLSSIRNNPDISSANIFYLAEEIAEFMEKDFSKRFPILDPLPKIKQPEDISGDDMGGD